MIQLEQIRKSYTSGKHCVDVLKGVDLRIREGELVAIMGSSGSGKSTLMNIMGLLDGYDGGSYHLAGTPMHGLSPTRAAWFRNHLIGFVFQSFNLLGFKTATENVALPLFYRKENRRTRNRIAREMLERVGLGERADHHPNELSGGQCQRVAIARALIGDPKIILADEPTGALDSQTTAEIMDLFKQVGASGKTVVIVTHEQDVAAQADRIIHIRDGNIVGDSGGGDV